MLKGVIWVYTVGHTLRGNDHHINPFLRFIEWTVRKKLRYGAAPRDLGASTFFTDPVINFLHGVTEHIFRLDISSL